MHISHISQISALALSYVAFVTMTATPSNCPGWYFVAFCTLLLIMFDTMSILGYVGELAWIVFIGIANWMGVYGVFLLVDMFHQGANTTPVMVMMVVFVVLYLGVPIMAGLGCVLYITYSVLSDELKLVHDVIVNE